MQKQNQPRILAQSRKEIWRSVGSLIWTVDANSPGQDAALSILKTLFDQPRWLEAYHLYDERGSQLFEKICALPEYYLTRTENAILAKEAARIIAAAPVECIVELGAGTSKKTLHLLREQVRQRQRGTFAPIDVSLTDLTVSRNTILDQLPQFDFCGLQARYEEGISSIEKSLPTLFVFLGSTVGNFNHSEFVRFFDHLSQSMGPEDFLLLGVDRIKEADTLEKAYNDSQSVTAEFILNVFCNVNRLLGGNFDLSKMRYHSWYNPEWQQVEMYGVSTSDQEITLASRALSFVWERGEKILVEISRKFEPDRLQKQLQCFGLKPIAHFTDPRDWFSLLLFKKSAEQ